MAYWLGIAMTLVQICVTDCVANESDTTKIGLAYWLGLAMTLVQICVTDCVANESDRTKIGLAYWLGIAMTYVQNCLNAHEAGENCKTKINLFPHQVSERGKWRPAVFELSPRDLSIVDLLNCETLKGSF